MSAGPAEGTWIVGTSVVRKEDGRILAGQGRYVGDVAASGMLHAAFVRSRVPHARVLRVDAGRAQAAPGVAAVFTDGDLKGLTEPVDFSAPMQGLTSPSFTVLAGERVRYVGDPVALVVADDRCRAEDAAELVDISYEPLPVVADVDEARRPGAPTVFEGLDGNLIYRTARGSGDLEAAFADADLTISERFDLHRVAPAPMEPRGGVATFQASTGLLTYEAGCQSTHLHRLFISRFARHPAHLTRVLANDIGGAFGQKWTVSREDIAICVAARELAGSVSWVEDRRDNLAAGGHARDERLEVEVAVRRDGALLGLRVRMVLDHGAYPVMPPVAAFMEMVRVLLPGAYRLDAYAFEGEVVATNKGSYVSYRGPWAVETLVRERVLDIVARELRLDPVDIRRRNLVTRADQPAVLVSGHTLDGVTVHDTLERALELVDHRAFRAVQGEARRQDRYLGFGIASFIEPAPGTSSFYAAVSGAGIDAEPARVRLEPDGCLTVLTGQVPHGQGHETTLAQLAADEVGVPFDRVRVVYGDTETTPFSFLGTVGSRAATMASGAVVSAASELRRRVVQVAAHMLDASAESIDIDGGIALVREEPERSLPLSRLAADCYLAPETVPLDPGEGLEVTAVYDGEGGGFSQATHCCWVEVDVATGHVRIDRFLVVEDCGPLINPAIVDGQIRGGVVQGIGATLYEHAVYDEEARFLSTSFDEYRLPTAMDVPDIEIHHLEQRIDPGTRIRFRGVGEGGAILAPAALCNAVEDALAGEGVRITSTPLTPTRILELLGRIPTS